MVMPPGRPRSAKPGFCWRKLVAVSAHGSIASARYGLGRCERRGQRQRRNSTNWQTLILLINFWQASSSGEWSCGETYSLKSCWHVPVCATWLRPGRSEKNLAQTLQFCGGVVRNSRAYVVPKECCRCSNVLIRGRLRRLQQVIRWPLARWEPSSGLGVKR
jgi:hypothetical protein